MDPPQPLISVNGTCSPRRLPERRGNSVNDQDCGVSPQSPQGDHTGHHGLVPPVCTRPGPTPLPAPPHPPLRLSPSADCRGGRATAWALPARLPWPLPSLHIGQSPVTPDSLRGPRPRCGSESCLSSLTFQCFISYLLNWISSFRRRRCLRLLAP